MRRRFIALILVFGFSLLSVLVVTPASAQTVPSITVDSATLVAKGAAVDVGTTTAAPCEAGGQVYVSLTVTQRVGKRVAQGYQSTPGYIPCTSSSEHIVLLRVKPYGGGGAAFTNGVALVDANATICSADFSSCSQTIETSQTIKIKKK